MSKKIDTAYLEECRNEIKAFIDDIPSDGKPESSRDDFKRYADAATLTFSYLFNKLIDDGYLN
ncbi:MAG: hypothetical protein PHQ72_14215 [Hespellia sp.]|nr:hypothetical protein [Hespellia sp.]